MDRSATALVVAAAAAAAVAAAVANHRRGAARRAKLPRLSWMDKTRLAVVRLAPTSVADAAGAVALPGWSIGGLVDAAFFSVTRTKDEISVVLDERSAPAATEHVVVEGGWIAFKIEGPLDFSLVGILSEIAGCLAQHGVSIFAVSTYDTDYVLLKAESKSTAAMALETAGYNFIA